MATPDPPSEIIVLRIIVMGVIGHSKFSSWPLMEMMPHGAAGSGGRSCFASIALRSLTSCSREYKITSRNVASGISTLSAGNHRVNTASSASERALYPDRRCGSFSGVMGTEPTLVPGMKFGTKTCLQKGA